MVSLFGLVLILWALTWFGCFFQSFLVFVYNEYVVKLGVFGCLVWFLGVILVFWTKFHHDKAQNLPNFRQNFRTIFGLLNPFYRVLSI